MHAARRSSQRGRWRSGCWSAWLESAGCCPARIALLTADEGPVPERSAPLRKPANETPNALTPRGVLWAAASEPAVAPWGSLAGSEVRRSRPARQAAARLRRSNALHASLRGARRDQAGLSSSRCAAARSVRRISAVGTTSYVRPATSTVRQSASPHAARQGLSPVRAWRRSSSGMSLIRIRFEASSPCGIGQFQASIALTPWTKAS
jgi:hypothetical protein